MATITWLDKIDGLDLLDPQKNVNAADMNQIKTAVNANVATAASDSATVQTNLNTHAALANNPHSVTKTQVGLSNVDNTTDATKLAAALAMFVWGETPSGSINDVNTVFTIANNAQKLAVYRNGIRQTPT